MSKLGYAFGAIVFGLGFWMLVIWVTGAPSFILPTPWRVVQAAWDNRALIGAHTLITATEVILGLSIGSALGIMTAIQLALSQRLYRVVMPLLVFTQAVPVFAIAPLLTLWLGYGIASKVLMAVLIIYFPVTSAFYDGLTRVPRDITDMARTMNGTRWQIMRRITIPHALPSLGTG
ncbi:MAG: ABC transporter permease subunit, partial [Pacificibacter sp.]